MIVIDLSCQDFQTGLSYVAVSRVKTLEGLMLDAPFDRNHLVYRSPPDDMKIKIRDQELRKQQMLTRNPYISHNTKNGHANGSVVGIASRPGDTQPSAEATPCTPSPLQCAWGDANTNTSNQAIPQTHSDTS
ncbi:ATP-dependent DNA helicase PIF1 [Ilyonectria robusta]